MDDGEIKYCDMALSESYEEVLVAACTMWEGYLPHGIQTAECYLVRDETLNNDPIVVRLSPSRFAELVREASPGRLELRLEIHRRESISTDLNNHGPAGLIPRNVTYETGLNAYYAGRYDEARIYFRAAIDYYRENSNLLQEAECFNHLGVISRHNGNYREARSHFSSAQQIYTCLGDHYQEQGLQCDRQLAQVDEYAEDYRKAFRAYINILAITQEKRFRKQEAWCAYSLGHLLNRIGLYGGALEYLKQATGIAQSLQRVDCGLQIEAFVAEESGYSEQSRKKYSKAKEHYEKALRLFTLVGGGKWTANENQVKDRLKKLPRRFSLEDLVIRISTRRSSTSTFLSLIQIKFVQIEMNSRLEVAQPRARRLDPSHYFPLGARSGALLQALIAYSPILAGRPHLKLTDVKLLESFLVEFASVWEHGTVILDNKAGTTLITNVVVDDAARKRKRPNRDDDIYQDEQSDEDTISSQETVKTPTSPMDTLYNMLQSGTAKGKLLAEQYRSDGQFNPICEHVTKLDCVKAQTNDGIKDPQHCDRVHFRPLIRPHTDPSLGHCSYLNTCYSEPTYALSPALTSSTSKSRPAQGVQLPSGLGAGGRGKEKAPCRYLHFEVDYDPPPGYSTAPGRAIFHAPTPPRPNLDLKLGLGPGGGAALLPPQWINCDVRRFDYSVLGKFHVIMADPPWDIHMSLPYGTMTDDEMRSMPIPQLQDEGLLFLWVTGRAMEVGRECMRVWGYTRVDEVVWLKTNQLQRVIRTGRTGHWLNHTKEHMLVGVKTNVDDKGNLIWPSWVNRGVDCDVIVSEVRETSRKPDEVYGMIERMCPGGRKIEIFGRKHNTRPGWITLGNQLGQDRIVEKDLLERVKQRYPERATQ
ncbi:MT-A70 protein, partial [Rhizoctonia solani]